ncbi:dienelactone hydrolase family protein [Pseudovibrio sp. Tun.PSC04-5.I4]|uniref:dienelactone hydrolase family protein n=1 Tax=Pseudovibrio sp. Tun.PSC04-5.I4 TaxID=1798213 RepID=UPI00087E9B70|nr:dienelactone hydrolase family protein [Pseudovibrio sp. Tun.PSC04-5.I4]SDR17619.1 Dienelactone hydrolase family protein [Pseudovibrio sp. Tun.PSC04-5.I4]
MIIAATTIALPGSLNAAELRLVEYHNRNLGYVVVPRASQKLPALLLFHDWFGLTEDAISQAAKIADSGYAVFILDLFNGKTPATREEAQVLIDAALENDEQGEVISNVQSGLKALGAIEEVEVRDVCISGFGVGKDIARKVTQNASIALCAHWNL